MSMPVAMRGPFAKPYGQSVSPMPTSATVGRAGRGAGAHLGDFWHRLIGCARGPSSCFSHGLVGRNPRLGTGAVSRWRAQVLMRCRTWRAPHSGAPLIWPQSELCVQAGKRIASVSVRCLPVGRASWNLVDASTPRIGSLTVRQWRLGAPVQKGSAQRAQPSQVVSVSLYSDAKQEMYHTISQSPPRNQ